MNYYLYIIFDPRYYGPFKYGDLTFELEPIYVGISKEKGTKRFREHLRQAFATDRNNIKCNLFRQIKRSHFVEPIFQKVSLNLDINAAKENEINTITKIGRLNLKTGPLSNLTGGGDGTRNVVVSDETRLILSEKSAGELNGFYNKTHSPESKKSMSETRKALFKNGILKPRKEEQSESMKKWWSEDTEQKKLVVSQKLLEFWENNPQLRKEHGEAQKKRWVTNSYSRHKMSINNKGIKNPNSRYVYEYWICNELKEIIFDLKEFCSKNALNVQSMRDAAKHGSTSRAHGVKFQIKRILKTEYKI